MSRGGTSFFKAPLLAFVVIVVTFGVIVLYPIGMLVSNSVSVVKSGDGYSDKRMKMYSDWCHVCLGSSTHQFTPRCFMSNAMVMVDGAVAGQCSNGNLKGDGVGSVSGDVITGCDGALLKPMSSALCSKMSDVDACIGISSKVSPSCSRGSGKHSVLASTPSI